MNPRIMLLVLALCVPSIVLADLSDGLVAYYPFQGSAVDASGGGHDGAVVDAVLTADRLGNPLSAYYFDGDGDRIGIGNGVKPLLPVSVSLWAYFDAVDGATGHDLFINDFEDGNTDYYGLFLRCNDGMLTSRFHSGGSAGPATRRAKQTDDVVFTVGRWYHVAVVFVNANDIRIYIDGIEREGTYSGNATTLRYSGRDGYLGARENPGFTFEGEFAGKLDEVRVYDRILSLAEIQQLAGTDEDFVYLATVGTSIYYLYTGMPTTWTNARDLCEARGGHLMTIGNEAENAVARQGASLASEYSLYRIWIGFTDEDVEGEWRWIDDTPGIWQDPDDFGTPIQTAYTSWLPGEPDDGAGSEDHACVLGDPGGVDGGRWVDDPAAGADGVGRQFVLEVPVESPYVGADRLELLFDNGLARTEILEPTTFSGYLYCTDPSASSIAGYEVALQIPADLSILSLDLPPGSINLGSNTNQLISYTTPQTPDVDGRVLLATMDFFYPAGAQADIDAGPASPPSVPGQIVYLDGADLSTFVPMTPVSGDFAVPIARINGTSLPWEPPAVTYDVRVDIALDQDAVNRAGAGTGATDGYDAGVDLLDANSTAQLWFPHSEWSVPGDGRFNHDIRASYDPTAALKTWTFIADVRNDAAGTRTLNIEFTPSFTANDGIGLVLHDRTAGTTVELFPSLSYAIDIPPYGRETRQFDLFVGLIGWSEEDTDADGVPDVADGCIGGQASYFDRNGDGCADEVIGARRLEYWRPDDLPLPYFIHADGAPGISDGSDLTAIQAGFTTWADIPDIDIGVAYQGTTPLADAQAMDLVNIVTFADLDWPFGAGVLAVGLSTSFTGPTWQGGVLYRPGQIIDADMIFNPATTFSTPTMGAGPDIQSIATHEAGHMLGLSHTSVATSTMFYVLPPLTQAADLEVEDELAMLKAYPAAAMLAATSHLRGAVTDGWTGAPLAGAIVLAIATDTGDTLGCEYSLPDDGSYHFIGLPDGDYWVAIHPLDGSSEIGYVGPANINALIRDHGVTFFTPEYYDAAESNTDDAAARTAVTVVAGLVTEVDLVTNVDVQGPRIVAVSPERDAAGVPVDATVLVEFSERVDPDSFLDQFNLSLSPGGALIPGAPGLVSDDRVLAYVLQENFEFATTYFLTLGDGITDVFGNPLTTPADSLQSSFTTRTRPTVSLDSVVPREGGTGTVAVINGDGFDATPAANDVQLGTATLTVNQATATMLVVSVPDGLAAGTHQLTVATGGQTSNPLNFEVLAAEAVPRGLGLASVALPADAQALAVTPAGDAVFVATEAGLTAVDVSLPESPTATSLTVVGGLDALSVTPGGERVYAVSAQNERLYRFQASPPALLNEMDLGGEPLELAIGPAGRLAYLPTRDGLIEVWDVQVGSLTFEQQIGTIVVEGGNLVGPLAVDPAGDRLLVLQGPDRLRVFATVDYSQLAEIAVGPSPRDVVIDPTGERAYVTHLDGMVSEVSLSSYTSLGSIPTGGSLRGADIKPTGSFVYAANVQLDDLDVIDLRPDSPTYRTVAGRVPHGGTPIDLAFSPDGLFAYSLAADDQVLVITATGEGPLLVQITPQAGPVGAQVVLTGSGFGSGGVQFNGVSAPILQASETTLTAVVPAGATTGPVVVLGDEPTEVSNTIGFTVLTPPGGDLRFASVVQPAGPPTLTAALAVSPHDDVAAIGGQDGRVHLLDIEPQSPTFDTFLAENAEATSPITDLVMAPDGAVVWAAAAGDPQLRAIGADPARAEFGTIVDTVTLPGGSPTALAVTPDGRWLLAADPALASVWIVELSTGAATDVSLFDAIPDLNGQIRALAVHPAGQYAYLAIGDDEPAMVLVFDVPGGTVAGVASLPTGTPAEVPISLAFAPAGGTCYVLTSQEATTPNRTVVALAATDVTNPTVAAATPLVTAGLPMAEVLRVSPAAGRLLVNLRDDGFYSLDLTTLTATAQPSVIQAAAPLDFAFSPDGTRLFAVSTADGQVYHFDFLAEQRLVTVWGDGQSGLGGEPLDTPLRVRVVDVASGEGSPGVPVTFTVNSGGGQVAPAANHPPATSVTTGTDQYGYAQVVWTLGAVLGEQQVEVTAAGAAGSPSTYLATGVEAAEGQPLQLVSELLSPPDLAVDVSATTSVLAVFNRAVDPASITDATFYLLDAASGQRVVSVIGLANDDRHASLTPLAPLANASQFVLHVAAGVGDPQDEPLANPVHTSFITVAPPPDPVLRSLSVPGAQVMVEIVISGSGFASTPAGNLVTFDGQAASVLDARADRLRARVPLGAVTGPVQVTVGGRVSNPLPFAVLQPPPPPGDQVVQQIATSTPTRAAVVSPDGTLLYALAPEADLVKPINLQTFQPLPGIPVGDYPRSLRIRPDGNYLYVVNEASGDVSVVDIAAGSPTCNAVTATVKVGTAPFDLEITPDGDRVIVVNPGSADVSIIDTDPSSENFNQVISRVETGSASRAVAVTPDGTRIYIGSDTGYLVLDAVDYGVIRNVSNGTATRAVAVSPDGTLLLIVDTQGGLALVDIVPGSSNEDEVVARPTSGTVVRSAAVSPDGTLLYVAQEDSDEILVFAVRVESSIEVRDQAADQVTQIATLVQVATVVAGHDPEGVVLDPVTPSRFFVTSATESAIYAYEPTAPPPLENLAAQPLVGANPGGSTFPLRLSWPAPDPGVAVQLYRKGFGNYPEYDDEPDAGAEPASPATPAAAETDGWTLVTETAAASHDDLVAARDCWYYVAFGRGPGGLSSGPSPLTAGTLNYLLGDVSDGLAPGTGDNLVDGLDISALGAAYGTAAADTAYRAWLDVGPTVEYSPVGRPLTDDLVEFEDLILLAVNYTLAGRPLPQPAPAPAPANLATLEVPALPPVGETFIATVRLAADGTLQGLSVPVTWQPGALELLEWTAGELLAAQGGPVMLLSPRPGVLDAALAGMREHGLSGEGELAHLRFRVLTTADPRLNLDKIKARTRTNETVAIGAETVTEPAVPTVFALRQAYPNPFNPATKIRYDIPRRTRAQLVVYDVAGRAVATLVDEEKAPGSYTVVWQGQDGRGRAVASGVYFYRLVAGDFEKTRKMLLLK